MYYFIYIILQCWSTVKYQLSTIVLKISKMAEFSVGLIAENIGQASFTQSFFLHSMVFIWYKFSNIIYSPVERIKASDTVSYNDSISYFYSS